MFAQTKALKFLVKFFQKIAPSKNKLIIFHFWGHTNKKTKAYEEK